MIDYRSDLEKRRGLGLTVCGDRVMPEVLPKPISDMPEEFKDGRKVLVFGAALYCNGTAYEASSKAWRVAECVTHINVPEKNVVEWVCDNDCIEDLKVTHFLPYPADPK